MANGDDDDDELPTFYDKRISRGGKVVRQRFDLNDHLLSEAICEQKK